MNGSMDWPTARNRHILKARGRFSALRQIDTVKPLYFAPEQAHVLGTVFRMVAEIDRTNSF